ncbi:MAG: tRNA (adenine(22)-N(1))-methyltransferase [Ezakiella massiliensis]
MDRLEQIVDLIEFEECLADVGCDHGYVGLELFKKGKIKKLIATDISADCLEKSNFLFADKPYDYEGRVGDGLKPIEKAEADAVVIAGMGGDLIAKIVCADEEKTKSLKKFIIQPMTEPEKVRKTFYDLGFTQTHDLIVKEKKHYYFVMVFELLDTKDQAEEDYVYTKLLQAHLLFRDYINHEIRKRKNIINEIKTKSGKDNAAIIEKENEIKELERFEN